MTARIDIDLARQELTLVVVRPTACEQHAALRTPTRTDDPRRAPNDANCKRYRYDVSTARNGAGERNGSLCTPRGRHRIRAKIGADEPVNTIFRGRRPTGEIYGTALAEAYPERDWILTRILWLCGEEPGRNRFGDVDTMSRYIYIHGAPDTATMGQPGSIGCIRMHNNDLIELFDRVVVGTQVDIHE